MKRITLVLLCILLCMDIVGCTANTVTLEMSKSIVPTSTDTETAELTERITSPETTTEESGTIPTDPLPDSPATEPIVTEPNVTDASEKPDTSPNEPTAPVSIEPQPRPTQPQETAPIITEPPLATPPKEDKPAVTEPTEPVITEPQKPIETVTPTEAPKPTEPPQPADPYAYPFDIQKIRQDCIAQARGYGFSLDSSLTPSNSSWSGAETANANTQGTRLKRFLREFIEYYSPAYRESMGLSELNITAFNIYCEDLGDGSYRIYFLFLL